MIALGNVGAENAVMVAKERLEDESPLVRGAAVWALSRLLETAAFEKLRQKERAAELDPDVLKEWESGAAEISAVTPSV